MCNDNVIEREDADDHFLDRDDEEIFERHSDPSDFLDPVEVSDG